jgi:membrane protein implicated in regulation of membrane protease activity
MSPLFLAALLLGLLLGVFAMLHGVERRPRKGVASATPSARLNLPTVAGFATLFGAAGYLLLRYSSLSPALVLAIAALIGAAGAAGAVALVARWAVPGAANDVEDPRYVLQGHLAHVTSAIQGTGRGEIAYVVDGVRQVSPAESLDGAPVPADTEVVIERIEDGVAHVERWAVVEERL